MQRKRRICFVADNVYHVLAGLDTEFTGGAEVQQMYIGEALAHAGYEVSYICQIVDGNRYDEQREGFRVFKTFSEKDGVPVVRFVYPRLFRLWQALKRADADVYYQRCASYATGVVGWFCRRYGRRLIFAASHDTNFIYDSINVPYTRDKLLYLYGLRHADHIFVQSEQQQQLLRDNFGLNGVVMGNYYPTRKLSEPGGCVLWAARFKTWKRPELYLQIARMFPDTRFVMIGGIDQDRDLYHKVERDATHIPNLDFLGYRTFTETERFFDSASLFINTSTVEGFPNTFLQAWSRGIPTVSFFDPDRIITRNRLGKTLASPDDLRICLRELIDMPSDDRARIQRYFEQNHSTRHFLRRAERYLT